jgi:hypothetical protein
MVVGPTGARPASASPPHADVDAGAADVRTCSVSATSSPLSERAPTDRRIEVPTRWPRRFGSVRDASLRRRRLRRRSTGGDERRVVLHRADHDRGRRRGRPQLNSALNLRSRRICRSSSTTAGALSQNRGRLRHVARLAGDARSCLASSSRRSPAARPHGRRRSRSSLASSSLDLSRRSRRLGQVGLPGAHNHALVLGEIPGGSRLPRGRWSRYCRSDPAPPSLCRARSARTTGLRSGSGPWRCPRETEEPPADRGHARRRRRAARLSDDRVAQRQGRSSPVGAAPSNPKFPVR